MTCSSPAPHSIHQPIQRAKISALHLEPLPAASIAVPPGQRSRSTVALIRSSATPPLAQSACLRRFSIETRANRSTAAPEEPSPHRQHHATRPRKHLRNPEPSSPRPPLNCFDLVAHLPFTPTRCMRESSRPSGYPTKSALKCAIQILRKYSLESSLERDDFIGRKLPKGRGFSPEGRSSTSCNIYRPFIRARTSRPRFPNCASSQVAAASA